MVVCAVIFALLAMFQSASAARPPSTRPIILRDLAKPRFFGAAANTSFLFNDKNYTDVISKQVRYPKLTALTF